MFELEKHYKDCKSCNQPFIKARKNPIDNNYLIQVDFTTCNYAINLEDQKNIEKLFKVETTFSTIKNKKKSIFKGSNINKEIIWYDGVLPSRLEIFCKNLFEISYKS